VPEKYRAIAGQIAEARGLAFTRPLTVHVEDAQGYHDRLAELIGPPPSDVADPDFRYAFGFSRLEPLAAWFLGLFPSSRDNKLAHEQIIGFYTTRDRALYLREDPSSGFGRAARQARDLREIDSWAGAGPCLCRLDEHYLAMVVAMVCVHVMQMIAHEIVDMSRMGNGLVTASVAMNMLVIVR